MTQKFANNASALLAASINDTDTTIQVAAGFGQFFPSPGAGEYALITLENADGDIEIVRYTTRSTDLLQSCTRGQEGTSAQSWTNGVTRVEARLTRGTMDNFLQKTGGEMSGNIDMDGNDLIDGILTGSGAKVLDALEIVNTPIRGVAGDTSNQLVVPDNGTRATAGGAAILCEGDDLRDNVFAVGMIMFWYGSAGDVPSNFQICDGTNGTPDMRGRFAVGVDGTFSLGAAGGAISATGNTASNGSHTHTASASETTLSEAQIPTHSHRIFAVENSSDSNADGWGKSGVRGIPGEDVGPFGYRADSNSGDQLIEDAGTGEGHTHTVTVNADGSHNHSLSGLSILPPYRALYYIMRV